MSYYCQCLWPHLLGHRDGRHFHCSLDLLSCTLHCCGGGRELGSAYLCHFGYCWVGGSHCCRWWPRDQSCGCLCGWRDEITGSSVPAVQLPVSVSTATAGGPEACGYLSCCYQVLWVCRLSQSGQGPRIVSNTCAVALVLPPLCIPARLPLDIQMYGFSGILSVLGRAALLSCGCFTDQRGETKDASQFAMMLMSMPLFFK